MRRPAWRLGAAVLLGAALSAACSDPTPPVAPSPAPPTLTDTFTGTLAVSGTNAHVFTVEQVGGVEVSLTSVDPEAAVGIGVGVPSPITGTCSVLSSMTVAAGSGSQLVGTATIAGSFCVQVSDVGNLVAPVTYTLVVFHS